MSDQSERPRRPRAERPSEDQNGAAGGARRTERLSPNTNEWVQAEPVNPGWRSERSTTRGARKGPAGALPASPQEFQLWLQAGGWRYLAGIAGLVLVLLIGLLAFGRGEQRDDGLSFAQPTAAGLPALGAGADSEGILQPTAAPEPTVPPAPQAFIVTGTSIGLFLRPEPNTNGNPITSLPDGTRVEQIGEDVSGPDRVWRNVRTPDGQTGWVAVEFLTPAP